MDCCALSKIRTPKFLIKHPEAGVSRAETMVQRSGKVKQAKAEYSPLIR